MTDRFQARLSEFLDGELTVDEHRLIERHLVDCESCAQTLRELEAVTARALEVTAPQPKTDLWPEIAERIADESPLVEPIRRPTRRRISLSMPQLAAAVVTVASLSAGLSWLAGRSASSEATPTRVAATTPRASGPVGLTVVTDAESLASADYYAASIAALESLLFDGERPLPLETEARVRRALVIIDGAIADARLALEEMPEDSYLREHVTDTMRRKTQFLRDAVRMAAQS